MLRGFDRDHIGGLGGNQIANCFHHPTETKLRGVCGGAVARGLANLTQLQILFLGGSIFNNMILRKSGKNQKETWESLICECRLAVAV